MPYGFSKNYANIIINLCGQRNNLKWLLFLEVHDSQINKSLPYRRLFRNDVKIHFIFYYWSIQISNICVH